MLKNMCPNDWVEKEEENLKLLQDPEQWQSIPLLNVLSLHHLPENTLVRFQGMIQDMYNPEYFLEKFEVKNEITGEKTLKNGKYFESATLSDNETVLFNSKSNVTKERHTLMMISVPAINKWVETIECDNNKNHVLGQAINAVTSQMAKRTLENDEPQTENPQTPNENKKQRTENDPKNSSSNSNSNLEDSLNFPLPDRKGKVCIAKIYRDADSIKLNDVVEIVGFLSFETDAEAPKAGEKEEPEAHPPSLAPRIHCVAVKKMIHNNPLVKHDQPMNSQEKEIVRKDLLIVLTQLMLGDELAAQYLLFNLISKIFGRVSLQPLGKFSLNVLNVPCGARPDYAKEIYEFVEMLMPKSHYFPMTLDVMNKTTYIPQKNYETDRLKSGLLQLSAQTHLVLDETKLNNGTLEAVGVLGVQNLKRTIETQTVTYDFGYYPMEFETDVKFLIFSEGKTMLSSDFHVKLNYDQETVDNFNEVLAAAKFFMKAEFLTNARKYLTEVQHAVYDVTEDMLQRVQEDYVEMRKDKSVTGEDLQNILMVARMLSLSSGKSKLNEESWIKACNMEKQRKEALKTK